MNTHFVRPIFLGFLVLLLSACFEFDAVVHINADGSGKAEFAYRFPEGLIDQTDLAGKIPLTQKDVDARYRMRAGVTQYRAEFRDLPKSKEVRLYLTFDDVSSLSERGNTFSYTIEGPYKIFRVKLDKSAVSQQARTVKAENQAKMVRAVLDHYKITYKVYLPEKIEQSNAQLVEWNAATWEIPLSVFLSNEKQSINLEAKTRVGYWERIKWRVSHLFS
jgi:hypothetical protein